MLRFFRSIRFIVSEILSLCVPERNKKGGKPCAVQTYLLIIHTSCLLYVQILVLGVLYFITQLATGLFIGLQLNLPI